jgi:hypothetical protein
MHHTLSLNLIEHYGGCYCTVLNCCSSANIRAPEILESLVINRLNHKLQLFSKISNILLTFKTVVVLFIFSFIALVCKNFVFCLLNIFTSFYSLRTLCNYMFNLKIPLCNIPRPFVTFLIPLLK